MPDTAIELEWADGRYRFALLMPQLLELERTCGTTDSEGRKHGKSVFTIFDEMSAGMARAGDDDSPAFFTSGGAAHPLDIHETIRLGLIGGGYGMVRGEEVKVGPMTAKQLVTDYGYPTADLGDVLAVAWAILNAAINGVRLKKKAVAADGAGQSLSEKGQ